jgi:hypothetical protein
MLWETKVRAAATTRNRSEGVAMQRQHWSSNKARAAAENDQLDTCICCTRLVLSTLVGWLLH